MNPSREKNCPYNILVSTFLGLLVALTAMLPAFAQNAVQENYDQPFLIVARSNTDANLYAMNVLNAVYEAWPSLDSDPEKLGPWFTDERQYVATMSGIVRARNLDPQIAGRYQDTLDMMSATLTYLTNLDLIRKKSADQAPLDLLVSIFNGYQTGSDVEGTAKKYTSDNNASNLGAMAGLASAYSNYQQRTGNRNATDTVATLAETRKVQDRWAVTQSALQATAFSLEKKYGWAHGEAGFDTFRSPNLAEMVAHSPRDPFIKASYASALSKQAKSGNDEVGAINAYLEAAAMVPDDPAFYRTRNEFIAKGAWAAIQGANLDSDNTFARATPSSGNAVKMARTYLNLIGQDQGGVGHYYLSLALGYAARYQEAIRAAQDAYDLSGQAWKNNISFCIIYASLMSLSGDEQEAVNWILKSYRAGFRKVSLLKTNADFAPLRQRLPQRFQEITSPKVGFHLRFDTHPASVVIQNNSDFDLVKPVLTLRIRKGQQVIPAEAACDFIQAGHSCQANNVVTVPGDADDGEDASISYANR